MNADIERIFAQTTGKFAVMGIDPKYATVMEVIGPNPHGMIWVREPEGGLYRDILGNCTPEHLFGEFDTVAEAKQVIVEAKVAWDSYSQEATRLRRLLRECTRNQKNAFRSRLAQEGKRNVI